MGVTNGTIVNVTCCEYPNDSSDSPKIVVKCSAGERFLFTVDANFSDEMFLTVKNDDLEFVYGINLAFPAEVRVVSYETKVDEDKSIRYFWNEDNHGYHVVCGDYLLKVRVDRRINACEYGRGQNIELLEYLKSIIVPQTIDGDDKMKKIYIRLFELADGANFSISLFHKTGDQNVEIARIDDECGKIVTFYKRSILADGAVETINLLSGDDFEYSREINFLYNVENIAIGTLILKQEGNVITDSVRHEIDDRVAYFLDMYRINLMKAHIDDAYCGVCGFRTIRELFQNGAKKTLERKPVS